MENQNNKLNNEMSEYDKFTEFAKRLLSVPKSEIQAKRVRVVRQKPTKA